MGSLNWKAFAVGTAAGAAKGYNDFKDEQRKWDQEQFTKDADAKRALHYSELERKASLEFKSSPDYIAQQDEEAKRKTQQEIDRANTIAANEMSPESIARRKALSTEETSNKLTQASILRLAEDKYKEGDIASKKAAMIADGLPADAIKKWEAKEKYGLTLPETDKLTIKKRNEAFKAANEMANDEMKARAESSNPMTPEEKNTLVEENYKFLVSGYKSPDGDGKGGGGGKKRKVKLLETEDQARNIAKQFELGTISEEKLVQSFKPEDVQRILRYTKKRPYDYKDSWQKKANGPLSEKDATRYLNSSVNVLQYD